MIDKILIWNKKIYEAYSKYLQHWDWEWFVVLTFWNDEKPGDAKTAFINWIRQLCVEEHIQIAGFYGIAYNLRHPHIHALLLGRGKTPDGLKTLVHVSPIKWQNLWDHIAKVESLRSNEDSSRYLAKHFLTDQNFDLDFYNLKLLKKLKS